jgi:hypothetical protein
MAHFTRLFARVAPMAYDAYRKALADISDTYPEVCVAAVGDYPLPGDASFDEDDVNASGAPVTSRAMATILRQRPAGVRRWGFRT